MDMKLLEEVLRPFLAVLLTVLVKYIITYLTVKTAEIKSKTNDATAQKYADMISDTIKDCVIATNQTYVDSLKGQSIFDKAAQEEAFKRSYDAVLKILSEEQKKYIVETTGDLEAFLTTRIEKEVRDNKAKKKDEE